MFDIILKKGDKDALGLLVKVCMKCFKMRGIKVL